MAHQRTDVPGALMSALAYDDRVLLDADVGNGMNRPEWATALVTKLGSTPLALAADCSSP